MASLILALSDLERINAVQNNEKIIRKRLKDFQNPMEIWTDEQFIGRYRFSKQCVTLLLAMLKENLTFYSRRNDPIPPHIRLLVALRFYASGHFQMTDGDLLAVHQSTTCRIVHQVTRAICGLRKKFICFPEDPHSLRQLQQKFHEIANFPRVIGAIDGTHIPIISPGGEDAEIYRNRKGYFSLNVQAMCNADMCFTNIVVRWPGSTHDSRMFENSSLYTLMETGKAGNGLILGDAGYPCLRYLLTPFSNPATIGQRRYNRAHIKTRTIIERTFGVLKQRFRCLRIPLRTKLNNSLAIIIAVACLHNFAMMHGDLLDVDKLPQEPFPVLNEIPDTLAGQTIRQNIVNTFFN